MLFFTYGYRVTVSSRLFISYQNHSLVHSFVYHSSKTKTVHNTVLLLLSNFPYINILHENLLH